MDEQELLDELYAQIEGLGTRTDIPIKFYVEIGDYGRITGDSTHVASLIDVQFTDGVIKVTLEI